jgi:SOS-response transcriptional repressor LexA
MTGPLPLTEQQEKLWRFIKGCERSPSYDEMMAALGTNSRGHVSMMIAALRDKGYVSYLPNRARSIVALEPHTAILTRVKTSDLLAELERRGILLGVQRG